MAGADGKAIVGAGRISREEMSDDFTFSLQVLPECRKKGGARDCGATLVGREKCLEKWLEKA